MNKVELNSYDLIVVGSGISGATIAYIAGHQYHQRVLVIEKEAHVGGLLFDERDEETGLLVQRKGAHFLHTNNEYVYKFLTGIAEWNPFQLEAGTIIDGKSINIPFHFGAIDRLYAEDEATDLKRRLAKEFRYEKYVHMMELLRSEDEDISAFAKLLMRKHFIPLTARQRDVCPESLNGAVMMGHFFQLGYGDGCYLDRFQMLPAEGFSALIEKMLDSPYITVRRNTDANKHLSVKEDKASEKGVLYWDGEEVACPVVYTASLDSLFDYRYGILPYRNLKISFETSGQRLSAPCVNSPIGEQHYSSTDFAYFNGSQAEKTVLSHETISPDGFPAFSANDVNGRKANRRYSLYRRQADRVENLYLCGRLAEYRFITIADAIAEAMNLFGVLPFSDIDLTPDYVKYKRPLEQLIHSGDNYLKNAHIASDLLIGDLDRELPEVTIVVPTYKRVAALKRALSSIWNQDISKDRYDVLVLDNDPDMDNETHQYLQTLKRDNLYYYKNRENLGAYGNMNRCMELARTDWVAMLHDDDVLFPNAIRWSLESKKELNDPKLGIVIPRQLQAHSKEEIIRRMKEHGIIDQNLVEAQIAKYPPEKRRWRLFHKTYERTRRRFWRISKFDCYMIPFLYPAPSYGTLINRKAILEIGGYGEGYPTDDNLCCIKMSEKYNCYLCGETWGVYSFYTADVMKPRSALQFVDAVVQYRLYMEKCSPLCRVVGKVLRQGAYLDAVEGDVSFGKWKRGYNTSPENYRYYKKYHAEERDRIRCRRIQKCWEMWILLRAVWFGKRISFDMVKRCNGEHV